MVVIYAKRSAVLKGEVGPSRSRDANTYTHTHKYRDTKLLRLLLQHALRVSPKTRPHRSNRTRCCCSCLWCIHASLEIYYVCNMYITTWISIFLVGEKPNWIGNVSIKSTPKTSNDDDNDDNDKSIHLHKNAVVPHQNHPPVPFVVVVVIVQRERMAERVVGALVERILYGIAAAAALVIQQLYAYIPSTYI